MKIRFYYWSLYVICHCVSTGILTLFSLMELYLAKMSHFIKGLSGSDSRMPKSLIICKSQLRSTFLGAIVTSIPDNHSQHRSKQHRPNGNEMYCIWGKNGKHGITWNFRSGHEKQLVPRELKYFSYVWTFLKVKRTSVGFVSI